MKYRIKRFFRAQHKAIKEEIQEIKSLEITDEDLKQAEKITDLVVQALGHYGYFVLPLKPIIKKAIAYGIRDLKDGVKTPNKLLLKRIIENYKLES